MKAKINKHTGVIEFLGNPPSGFRVGGVVKRRFSEIVPTHPLLRIAFRVLRWCFGEEGRAAAWTRRWSCRWEAVILIGNMAGARRESDNRAWLLEWEKRCWFEPLFEL